MEFRSCINYLLTTAQREVSQQINARLSKYNLTSVQYGILNYLWEHTTATPKELAQTLHVENSTISGILDRMQKKGLVDRKTDEADRRIVRVYLTEDSEQLKEDVLKTVDDMNEEILKDLTPENREILLESLRTICRID